MTSIFWVKYNLTEVEKSFYSFKNIPRKEEVVYLNLWKVNNLNELNLFPNLQVLKFTDSFIEELPDCVLEMQNLTELHCNYTLLKSLPDNIDKLKKLRKIYCNKNHLTSLPNSICNITQLEILWICEGNITYLPEDIYKLENLEYLCFRSQDITSLPKSIIELGNTIMYFDSDKITVRDEELYHFLTVRGVMLKNRNYIFRVYSDEQNLHISAIQESMNESISILLQYKSGNISNL